MTKPTPTQTAMHGRSAHVKRLLWAALASASLAISCLSGQTGSADCAPVEQSCACDSLAEKSLVKATVLAIDVGSVEIQIEQVLNPNSVLGQDDVNEQLSLTLSSSLSCAPTNRELPLVGDSVFVAFQAYSQPDANAVRYGGEALVRPWSDTIDLGSGVPLLLSDAVALSDRATCEAKYPSPAAPPCDDTSGAVNCSLSAPPSRRAGGWALAFALFGLAVLRRRAPITQRRFITSLRPKE